MIRILHVIGSLEMGGSQTMVMNLYRNIDRNRIQFDFIIDHTNHLCFEQEINELGGKIYIMPTFKGYNLINVLKKWNDFFLQHSEYKIIHSHVRSYAAIFLLIARKNGLFTIAHSHSTSAGRGVLALVKLLLQYPLRFIADYFFACSKEAGIWLFGRKRVNADNFCILKNGIDIDKFLFNGITREAIRKELGIGDAFVIGNVARFHALKNHSFLINVFERLYMDNPDSYLVLVGEGDLRGDIEKKIGSLKSKNNILFLDSRNDVNELMQAFDLFMFPSLREGLGIVAIEAQCASLPVMCSTGVPYEVKITENIQFLKLCLHDWVEMARNISEKERQIVDSSILFSSGYSVVNTVNYLTKFYTNEYYKKTKIK